MIRRILWAITLLFFVGACSSDRKAGQNNRSLDPAEVLAKVRLLEVRPDAALPAQWITILGDGFDLIESGVVLFAETGASNVTWSTQQIDVQVPPLAPGMVTLTLAYKDQRLPGLSFTIMDPDASGAESADTQSPDTRIDSGPPAQSQSADATFVLSGSDDQTAPGSLQFVCRIDNDPFSYCDSLVSFSTLGDSSHRFEAAALDAAGNRDPTPAFWDWTIDTSIINDNQPPQTLLLSSPPSVTSIAAAVFTFSASDDVQLARTDCQLDDSAFAACTSPVSYAGLEPGRHSFAVRAVDANGNMDPSPASSSWVYSYGVPLTVVAGTQHACVIKSDGSLWCFGDNYRSQTGGFSQPLTSVAFAKSGSAWQEVSLGHSHGCGRKQDNSLWCWGLSFSGAAGYTGTSVEPLQVGSGTDWIQVSIAGNHTCARKSNKSLWCFGDNRYGQLGNGGQTSSAVPIEVSAGSQWRDVSVGAAHTCAVRADQTLWCWGRNNTYQTGQTIPTQYSQPLAVNGDTDWLDVETGTGHSCARKSDQSLWCWGSNGSGQLGNGTSGWGPVPVKVPGDPWKTYTLGGNFSCATDIAGTNYCWGDNSTKQITTTTNLQIRLPVTASLQGVSLTTGSDFACAVTQGLVGCAGRNNRGQLGRGFAGDSAAPVAITGSNKWVTMTASYDSTCAIDDGSAIWCWGNSYEGRLGVGFSDTQDPIRVTTTTGWRSVANGWYHQCAVSANRDLWCWGDNNRGQLGDNKASVTLTAPTLVSASSDWKLVAAGQYHSCGIKTDGTLWCWGNDDKGQLGDGGTIEVPVPRQIGSANWISIASGKDYNCAIQSDATLWCWGANYSGQLGNGTTDTTRVPVQAGTAQDWVQASTFAGHTCGIRSNNSLWCWGANYNGQLGRSEYGYFSTPQATGVSYNWQSVSVGYTATCALTTGNRLYCWGGGWNGQNALGSWLSTPAITAVSGATWLQVSLGQDHGCGIDMAGKGYCWGSNGSGQLGTGRAWLGLPDMALMP